MVSSSMLQAHLKEYLDYYRTLSNPQYAVLVTGDWGVGKTFQVRSAIPRGDCYYVSLFGLSSTDDVVSAVYAAMFPRKALVKKAARGIGETTAEIPGFGSLAVSGLTSALVGAFLRQAVKTDKPIVLDDLERSGLKTKDLLGAINLYVEHNGCQVVVIAHDKKLKEKFADMKEKLFGQTIVIEPNISAAFDAFCMELAEREGAALVVSKRDDIIGVFTESGVQSLRILRHVVEDLVRLAEKMSDRYRASDAAMVELFRLFAAFDIEWRDNRLELQDLRNRGTRSWSHALRQTARLPEAGESGFLKAVNRYKSLDLTNTLLQDDVLCEMIAEGRFNQRAIEASLDASAFFIKPQQSAPWQVVMAFDKLDDATVSDGLAKMQEQFDGRQVSDSGEMLHIFALRMMLSTSGVLQQNLDTVTEECKRYIDDLLSSGKLPPRPLEFRWADELSRSAYHVGYWVAEEYQKNFGEVFRHLTAARETALEKQFPEFAAELLQIVKTDGKKFVEQVCYTAAGNNRFAAVPVLASIDPKVFVAAWMQSERANWYWISRGLQERYSGGHIKEVSEREAYWRGEVVRLLDEEAKKATGLAKLRIRRITPQFPHLDAVGAN